VLSSRRAVAVGVACSLFGGRQEAVGQTSKSVEIVGAAGARWLACTACRSSRLFVGQISGWLGLVGGHRAALGIQATGELAWGSPDRHRGFDLSAQFRVPLGPSQTYWIAPSAGGAFFRLSAPGKLGTLRGFGPRIGVRILSQHQAGGLALRPSVAFTVDMIESVTFKVSGAFIPPIPGDTSALYARSMRGYRNTQITVGLGIARAARQER